MKTIRTLFFLSLGIFIFIMIFGFIAYGPIKKSLTYRLKSLRSNTLMGKIYTNYKSPFFLCIYFFNITNPQEASQGFKPHLKQVGPYCYDVYKNRINPVVDKKKDTIELSPIHRFYYDQKKTSPLSHDDYVTILNPLYVGIVNGVSREASHFLRNMQAPLDHIFGVPKSIYTTVKVRDLLFDGVPLDCRSDEVITKAICGQIRARIKNLVEPEENLFMISLLGPINSTEQARIKVRRGVKNKYSGEYLEINHVDNYDTWNSAECNKFSGTDGWINKPFITSDVKTIPVVVPQFCRNLEFRYNKTIKLGRLPLLEYRTKFNDPEHDDYEKCFCPKSGCLGKGLMDLYQCTKIPFIVTLPHFLYAEQLLDKIDGLQPDLESHLVQIFVDKISGSPVQTNVRVQINLETRPVPELKIMKNLSKTIHPILWLDESFLLDSKTIFVLKFSYHATRIIECVRWFIAILAAIGMAVSAYYYYKSKN